MPGGERIVDFAESSARLSADCDRLLIRATPQGAGAAPPGDAEVENIAIPFAEIAVVVLANPRISITQPALDGLCRNGAAVIACDGSRMPVGMMLPINANTLATQRMRAQVKASLPTCKRLWKVIVRTKILAQAGTLKCCGRAGAGALRRLAGSVRSGDPENCEGRAAGMYWPLLFDDPAFRRRRDADDANRLLNYGYAVLRAAVGRAVCAAGLHPSVGIHHTGRNNAYVLADDLMEPYRPLIDASVVALVGLYGPLCPLDGEAKRALISTLTERIDAGSSPGAGGERTVLDCVARSAASLAAAFDCSDAPSAARRLWFPEGLIRAPDAA